LFSLVFITTGWASDLRGRH